MSLLAVPPAWRTQITADGLAVVAQAGAAHGALRIREQVRPLRPARQLLAQAFRGEPTTRERLVTAEGEHAVLALRRDPAGLRAVALVFGDDDLTVLDGAATEELARFEGAIRFLVHFTSLGLGHLRRRRYHFSPPTGWGGVAAGLDASFHAPGFPRERALVTVHAAEPTGDEVPDVLGALRARLERAGWTLATPPKPERLTSRHGLSGRAWRLGLAQHGVEQVAELAVLEDERFTYAVESIASPPAAEAAHRALRGIAESAEGIPLPDATRSMDSLHHWSL